MTLMPRKLIAQQGSDAKVPAEDLRLALSSLFSPGVGANVARAGILRGSNAPGFTACQVVAAAASTFTVKQGAFIAQQTTVNGGAYIGIIDSDQTLTLAPPAAGQYKAGYVIAHCYDEAYGDLQDGFALEVVLGAAATSAASAAYPGVPNNSVILRGFTVDGTGTITLTTQPTYTGSHNGILPVLAGDTSSGVFDGQWRDEPNLGLQRWNSASSAWIRPHALYLGAGTSFPGTAQVGDTFTRSDVGGGAMFLLTINGWQLMEEVRVASLTARNALPTSLLSAGDRVSTAAGDLWIWNGSSWSYPVKNTVMLTGTATVFNCNTMPASGPLTTSYRLPFTVNSPTNPALFTIASSTLTCVQAGWYLVSGSIAVNTNSKATTGSMRFAAPYLNGAQVDLPASGNQLPPNLHSYQVILSAGPIHLNAGDTLDLRFAQDSGDVQPVDMNSSFLSAQFLTI